MFAAGFFSEDSAVKICKCLGLYEKYAYLCIPDSNESGQIWLLATTSKKMLKPHDISRRL